MNFLSCPCFPHFSSPSSPCIYKTPLKFYKCKSHPTTRMNITERKAGRWYNYNLLISTKHTIICFLFLTIAVLCTRYFTASYGTLVQIVSNSSYLPIQQDEVVDKVVAEVKKEAPHFRSLTDPAYTFSPKINNWDLNRAMWLRLNPAFPNFFSNSKPRVLLVTGSSPKPCANSVGDHYQLKAIKNKMDYCRIHGIDIYYNMAFLDAEMTGFWAKLPLLRSLLLSHPEVLQLSLFVKEIFI